MPLAAPVTRTTRVASVYTTSCGRSRHNSASASVSICSVAWPMPKRSRSSCVTSCSLRLGGAHRAHEMRGQRGLRRAEPPDVQIVHLQHAGQRGQIVLHLVVRHAAGHRVHRQVDRFAQQSPGGHDDDDADRRDWPADRAIASRSAGSAVPPPRRRPTRRHRAAMCRNCARMLRSPPRPRRNISAVTPFTTMPAAATRITVHLDHRLRREQPPHRLHADGADADQQDRGVQQRGEDGAAPPAIGAAARRRPAREPGGAPAEQQTQHVTEIMRRIGQQRHRVGGTGRTPTSAATKPRFSAVPMAKARSCPGPGVMRVMRGDAWWSCRAYVAIMPRHVRPIASRRLTDW